jgi:hypothetical protein
MKGPLQDSHTFQAAQINEVNKQAFKKRTKCQKKPLDERAYPQWEEILQDFALYCIGQES